MPYLSTLKIEEDFLSSFRNNLFFPRIVESNRRKMNLVRTFNSKPRLPASNSQRAEPILPILVRMHKLAVKRFSSCRTTLTKLGVW
jgi:hypothetical protein